MSQCAGIKRDGGRCTVVVAPSESYCYHHAPERAEERKRNASKGSKSRGAPKEIANLKNQLKDLADGVLSSKIERADAVVVNQILNTQLRSIELGRRIDSAGAEERAFEVMLGALEERLPREEFEHAVHALAGMDGRWW